MYPFSLGSIIRMSLFAELKRRNVVRVTIAYLVAAWVIVETSSLILEIYESPDSVIRVIVALLALGLPFAIVFAWAFEITPEGIKRESEVDRDHSVTHITARRLDVLTIGLVVLAIGLFAGARFFPDQFAATTQTASVNSEATQGVAWATENVLEIARLRDLGDFGAAFALASEVAPDLGPESTGDKFWAEFSWTANINSAPSGARVYRQNMDAPADEWEDLGTTPAEGIRFAEGGGYRLRFELEGYRTVEALHTAIRQREFRISERIKPVRLDPVDVLPAEMVRVTGFTVDLVDYDDFFMDRFELTNREYQEFVTAGGYENKEYWTEPYTRDGEEIHWKEAVAGFVDRTGRPGPSTWSGGTYPSGKGKFPVGGVSWYEAAAFAKFAGKELPTETHFDQGRRYFRDDSWIIASRSNFGGEGAREVGENRAMTTLGIYDLVGNVREWGWNEYAGEMRGVHGAGWTDPPYAAGNVLPKLPWDRDATNGIRLIRTFDSDEKLAKLRQPGTSMTLRDFSKETPVSDTVFEFYKRMYAYDPLPLNAGIVATVEFEHWARERVEFDLPYGERGAAILYIPNNAAPPFEVVLYWPGSNAFWMQSIDEDYLPPIDFIIRSGRVVAQPIFKGTYDRDDENFSIVNEDVIWGSDGDTAGKLYLDYQIKWMQEMSRTIDYLETRDDINSDRLGYNGFSWGGFIAPIALAVENRIDVAVLNVGGLDDIWGFQPEGDPFNFVTRVSTPVLMINGEFDIVAPLETSQKPMFELLGTDPAHKKLYVTSKAHIVPRDELIRETLSWYDRYLSDSDNQE
jgi:hypothetical protein